jgi:predicted TPR repeat methyltransferase
LTTESPFTKWEKKIPRRRLIDRDTYILSECLDQDVAHLGACDYPMTLDKAGRGELLHQKLGPYCRSLCGIDNDAASIKLLREKFGIDNIMNHDMTTPLVERQETAGVVVCADIIEHVGNVMQLLAACYDLLRPDGTLILSTINATSLKQAMRALAGREPVHPDHVAYFSYATLGVLLARAGFEMVDCRFFPYRTVGPVSGMCFGLIHRLSPASADGIVVKARKLSKIERQ